MAQVMTMSVNSMMTFLFGVGSTWLKKSRFIREWRR